MQEQELEQLVNGIGLLTAPEWLYLVDWPALPATVQSMHRHPLGLLMRSGAVLIRPELEAAGRWRGPGSLVGIRGLDVDVLVHEAAHAACAPPATAETEIIAAVTFALLIDKSETTGPPSHEQVLATARSTSRRQHSAAWVRAVCHCKWRLERLTLRIDLRNAVRRELYDGMPDPQRAYSVLLRACELQRREGETIRDIVSSPSHPRFEALFAAAGQENAT